MHRRCAILLVRSLTVATFGVSFASGAEPGPNENPDIAAVRAAASDYAAAARDGNVDVMRRSWTPEGDYIDASGQRFVVHELLAQERVERTLRPSRQPSAEQAQAPSSTLRLITPTVAIEDGVAEISTAHDGSAPTGRFTAVWVKLDGKWLLDSLRESISQSDMTNDRLQPLSWLLGEWAGAVDDQAIIVSSNWSDGGNYIVREFAIHGAGDQVVTGNERIGWDPVSGEVMSWAFDSQGGRSESRWKRDGERWLVESTKVMSDGKKATSASVYTPGDGGSYSWEVSRASVADERLPQVRIEFKRAADKE
jgi:hypothetical protein